MDTWLFNSGLIALAGVVLIVFAWRGRRVDDHPLCRRCGFDLTGRPPDSTRCAECGADVTRPRATRIGHRRRRGGVMVVGVALALPAMLVLVAVVFVRMQDFELTPYKPNWLLARDVVSGNDGRAKAKGLAELTRRLQAGSRVSDRSVASVAAVCLANQGDRTLPWNPAWGHFLEAARAAEQLPDEAWGRYASQGVQLELYLRSPSTRLLAEQSRRRKAFRSPRVRARNLRIANATFTVLWDCQGFSVDDGGPVPLVSRPERRPGSVSDGRIEVSGGSAEETDASGLLLDMAVQDRNELDLHTLRTNLRVRIFDSDGIAKAPRSRSPSPPVPPKPDRQISDSVVEVRTGIVPVWDVEGGSDPWRPARRR